MKITKHRQKILDTLQQWFSIHKQGPTLEKLCQELGMQPGQKATVQRWLQTMRGIDVEWEDHSARSLHLLTSEPARCTLFTYICDGYSAVSGYWRGAVGKTGPRKAKSCTRSPSHRNVPYVLNFFTAGRTSPREPTPIF